MKSTLHIKAWCLWNRVTATFVELHSKFRSDSYIGSHIFCLWEFSYRFTQKSRLLIRLARASNLWCFLLVLSVEGASTLRESHAISHRDDECGGGRRPTRTWCVCSTAVPPVAGGIYDIHFVTFYQRLLIEIKGFLPDLILVTDIRCQTPGDTFRTNFTKMA